MCTYNNIVHWCGCYHYLYSYCSRCERGLRVSHFYPACIYSTIQKLGLVSTFSEFHAHQGCIYLIKKQWYCEILLQFKIAVFYFLNILECILWQLYFQHHYSLKYHMILQKSFWYADLVLSKHFLLLSMLKTFFSCLMFVETKIFFQDSLMNRKFKRTAVLNRNLLYHYKYYCCFINLMHPFWIQFLIS